MSTHTFLRDGREIVDAAFVQDGNTKRPDSLAVKDFIVSSMLEIATSGLGTLYVWTQTYGKYLPEGPVSEFVFSKKSAVFYERKPTRRQQRKKSTAT